MPTPAMTPQYELPSLLTFQQTCQFLNVKPSHLYYLTSMDLIPHFKIGGSLRFDRCELVAWLNKHRRGPRG